MSDDPIRLRARADGTLASLSVLVVSISVCLTSPVSGQDEAARVRQVLVDRGFMGVALVARGDQVLFKEAFGAKDLEGGLTADVGTAYEVGSVSKPLTATAILMLAERGALSLGDPLTKFFPGLPYEDVTIERVLSHTAGLYDVCCEPELRARFLAFFGRRDRPYTNSDYLAFIEQETPPLLWAPGEAFRYSNFGFVLLALVVEEVSGLAFDDFLEENVFEPIGLERTFVLSLMEDPTISNMAVGYRRTEGAERGADPVRVPQSRSDGGASYGDDEVVSTVDDLHMFGRALARGELLSAETLGLMRTPARLTNGEVGPYGLGVRVQERPDGSTVVMHTGSTAGFLALTTFPTHEDDVTVILLTNVVRDGFAALREAVFDVVWGLR
jgi:CubicO group peptidase (beta-lactamase class C family)